MSTDASERMKSVVDAVAPTLKAAGFRKRRHTFNRAPSEQVTHVLNFQMGAYDPPGTTEIPGLRPNLYGKFTINVGVFSPEMRVDAFPLKSAWISEYDCQLRQRIGWLLPARKDVWWSLDEPGIGEIAGRAGRSGVTGAWVVPTTVALMLVGS